MHTDNLHLYIYSVMAGSYDRKATWTSRHARPPPLPEPPPCRVDNPSTSDCIVYLGQSGSEHFFGVKFNHGLLSDQVTKLAWNINVSYDT